MTKYLTPRRAALLVAAVAFVGYLPVLGGEFLDFDDDRFVRDNPAVHRLGFDQVASYFTDPETVATRGIGGIYRPLRTLDFAIDWAISGGRPWFFHLRNVLYHVLGALLVLALCRRLSRSEGNAALFGALLFAVHPLNTEAVAWITSRGDLLLLVTFLSALLLHITGRRVTAAAVLVIALFSKEAAAVFPAVAFLVDRYRREPFRWHWYAIYAGIVGLYVLLWIHVRAPAPGQDGLGHLSVHWGGSYGATLLTMSRGVVLYASLILLPVHQTLEYFMTMTTGFDLGAALGLLILLAAAFGAWRGGPRVRFAVLWFAVTLLPTSNLLITVGVPTAERFLYLPMVGLCFAAGRLFARFEFAWVPVFCLLLLTFQRSIVWQDTDRLMAATRAETVTPNVHLHFAEEELQAAYTAIERGDLAGRNRRAERVIALADELTDSWLRRTGSLPGPFIFVKKSNALFLLERYEDSLRAAEAALIAGGGKYAHYNAGAALMKLGRYEESARQTVLAIGAGYDDSDLRPIGAWLFNAAAVEHEKAGEPDAARKLYQESLDLLPDPGRRENAEALEGLRRLAR